MAWWIFVFPLSVTPLGVWSLLVPFFTPSISLFPLPGLLPISVCDAVEIILWLLPLLVMLFHFLRVTFFIPSLLSIFSISSVFWSKRDHISFLIFKKKKKNRHKLKKKNYYLSTNGNNHTFFFVSSVLYHYVSLSFLCPSVFLHIHVDSVHFLLLCVFLSSLCLFFVSLPFFFFSFSSPHFPSICFTFSVSFLSLSLLLFLLLFSPLSFYLFHFSVSFFVSLPFFFFLLLFSPLSFYLFHFFGLVLCLSPFLLFLLLFSPLPSICFTFSLPALSLCLSPFFFYSFSSPFFPSICFTFSVLVLCLSPFLLSLLLFSPLFFYLFHFFAPCLSQLSFYLYPVSIFPVCTHCSPDCTHLCPGLYICPFLYSSAFHCFSFSPRLCIFSSSSPSLCLFSLSCSCFLSLYLSSLIVFLLDILVSIPVWVSAFTPLSCAFSLCPWILIRVSVSAIQRFSIPVFPVLLFPFGSSFALLIGCLTKQLHFMGCASKPSLFVTHKQTADYLNVHFKSSDLQVSSFVIFLWEDGGNKEQMCYNCTQWSSWLDYLT